MNSSENAANLAPWAVLGESPDPFQILLISGATLQPLCQKFAAHGFVPGLFTLRAEEISTGALHPWTGLVVVEHRVLGASHAETGLHLEFCALKVVGKSESEPGKNTQRTIRKWRISRFSKRLLTSGSVFSWRANLLSKSTLHFVAGHRI